MVSGAVCCKKPIDIYEKTGDDKSSHIKKIKALKIADTMYKNYSGIRNGVEGEVRFLIETDEIK